LSIVVGLSARKALDALRGAQNIFRRPNI